MKKAVFVLLAMSFLFYTCVPEVKKNVVPPKRLPDLTKNVELMDSMIVPDDFNYEISKDVNVSIGVNDAKFGDKLHVILIYNGDPADGGSLLTSGSASNTSKFESVINIPSHLPEVYVVRINPAGEMLKQPVAIVGKNLNLNLMKSSEQKLMKKAGPNCSSGCTTTYNNRSSSLTISSGVACITGTMTANLTISGTAEVRICGTANIPTLLMSANGAKLIVTEGSILNVTNNMTSSKGAMDIYGTVTYNGNFTPQTPFTINNYGTLKDNNASILDLAASSSVILNNYGTISFYKISSQANTTFNNYCKVTVNSTLADAMLLNGNFNNYSYVKCYGEFRVNTAGITTLSDGAMISTKDFQVDKICQGTGANSFIKVSSTTNITATGSVTGNIMYCDLNGIETGGTRITSGAIIGCYQYIPVTSCNTEGNGVADTDGDGILNDLDAYPEDPTRAFNNYYPSASGWTTVAFEDLWPNKGDYDLNDIVVDIRHNAVTNSLNKVTQVQCNYILRAHGGNQSLSFNVEFPTGRTNVNSLAVTSIPSSAASRVGFESNSALSKAVLTLFDDVYAVMANWNTVLTDVRSDTIAYSISFNLISSVALATFGVNEYNPFIYAQRPDRGRGYEIHLPGKLPTALANTAAFGKADDNTNPGQNRYYLSKNNLPWGVLVPTRFEYPIELQLVGGFPKPDLTQVYLKFSQWAQSGGTMFPDWYSNMSAGYRTSNNWIYRY